MRTLTILILLLLLAAPARAQENFDHELATAYLRVFVGEAGWTNDVEHAAIAHTVLRRVEHMHASRGWSELDTLRAYARNSLTTRPRTPRGQWVTRLTLDCAQPPHWPPRVRWTIYEGWCRQVAANAIAWVRGDDVFPDPCDGPSEHWGSRRILVDQERARRAVSEHRWREVHCGHTGNGFFAER